MKHIKTYEDKKLEITKDNLQELVNKYETRLEFKQNNLSAYNHAYNLNILNDLFKNHPNQGFQRTSSKKYTKEYLQELVNKYETRYDFQKNNQPAYLATIKRKLLNELFKNHPNQGLSLDRNPNNYWTKEKIQKEADKYETRYDFSKKNILAYGAARKRKLVDELFKNHPNKGYLTKEEWIKNSYTIYAYELPIFNKAYIGLTNNIIRRDKEHVFDLKTKLNKFCKENDMPMPKYKILEKNLNPIDAKQQEHYWMNKYKENNWELFNIAKAGSLGGGEIFWTKPKIQNLAKQFKTRMEFKNAAYSAYSAALKYKILDDLFKDDINQGYIYRKKRHLSDEELRIEADKYNTRSEFKEKDPGAYQKAKKNNILNDIFKK